MFTLRSVRRQIAGLVFLLAFTVLMGGLLMASSQVKAQSDDLGATLVTFDVLAGTTVTNTGPTSVGGNVGVSPGSAVTGFPPGVVVPPATIHSADALALQAQTELTTAYNTVAGAPCTGDLTGQDLGGLTLTPGVYCFSTSAPLTGLLTLDAQGNAAAVFMFQIGSTLTTASSSSVEVVNGGTACNVYWQVGSSATLGTGSAFEGNILALTSITLTTGATLLPGRALARNGAVTLDTNTIDVADCAVAPTFTATPTATFTPTSAPARRAATQTPMIAPTVILTSTLTTQGVANSSNTSQGVVGLPNTGGGPPQPTYWMADPGR